MASVEISDCCLGVYVNHLDTLREDFNIRFGDLDNKHVPEWLVTPFDMKVNNKVYESGLEDELIEIHVESETKASFKSKNLA